MCAAHQEARSSVQTTNEQDNDVLRPECEEICLLLQAILKLDSTDRKNTGTWLRELATLYAQLERKVAVLELSDYVAVKVNRRVGPYLADLYAIRARWEERLETLVARRAIDAKVPIDAVHAEVDRKVDMLPKDFFAALAERERILFVGSGPFPTTAMAIARELDQQVTCLDLNQRANVLGSEFIAAGRMSASVSIVHGALETFEAVTAFDTIVTAFLVGVGTRPSNICTKSQLIEDVVNRLPHGSRMVIRTTLGAGDLIYPSVKPPNKENQLVNIIPKQSAYPVPYDLPLMIVDCV